MRPMLRFSSVALLALLAASPTFAQERVVVVGGAIGEIVYELGQEARLIGRDTTSFYPPAIAELPDVGYIRALSPEGLLALDPDLILSDVGAGPAETVDLIRAADVPFTQVEGGFDEAGVRARIEGVAEALSVDPAPLLARVEGEFAELAAMREGLEPLRVLFIISATGGRINASGTGTAASGMIALAGATNAVTEFEGYRQLTDEALITAAPDVVLMMDRGGDHAMSDDEIAAHPALALTPAGQNRRVVRMDGLYLLGYGPRTALAAQDLIRALHEGQQGH